MSISSSDLWALTCLVRTIFAVPGKDLANNRAAAYLLLERICPSILFWPCVSHAVEPNMGLSV
eukprot:2542597-Pyramimonas_sp.AAC.1